MRISRALRCSTIVLAVIFMMTLCILGMPAFSYADDGGDPTADGYIPNNGKPVVYIDIDESRGTIDQMNSDPDHATLCYGTITIDVPEGFHYSAFPDTECVGVSDLDMQIRGRGNSTWDADKKPYKIKLDSKADIFGLGENKHWVLIANAYDPTFQRDRITGWLGDKMGFEFTPPRRTRRSRHDR